MDAAYTRTFTVCGLTDGHTLIDCPNKFGFCGDSITRCQCLDSSLVRGVMDSETTRKSTSKRNANPVIWTIGKV